MHDIRRRTPLGQLMYHELHVRIHITEKVLVPCAEIVETILPILGPNEPVLRALAVASETNAAFETILGKFRELLIPELGLLGGMDYFVQRLFRYIAQLILRIDKVVT